MQRHFNKSLESLARTYNVKFLTKFSSILPSLPYIYGLPKIHKKDNSFRPIISNVNAPSYRLSKWLAKQLSPLMGNFSNSHLRNNVDLINYLKDIIPGQNKFLSFDVKSLFTNVPLKPTLEFLQRKLCVSNTGSNTSVKFDVPVECLFELIKLCLDNSYFQFENKFYEQIFGMAMGNPLSPVLAGLFLEHVESEILPLYTGVHPVFWKRYVDDILCLVPENFVLEEFLGYINSLYPTLKFTHEWEVDKKIPFLDVLIHRPNSFSKLKLSVFRKSTNAEAYLHYFSCAALHIKIGLAQSLFLRALRICDPEFLEDEINHIYLALGKLAYPRRLLKNALLKAKKVFYKVDDRNKNKNKASYNRTVPR